MIASSCLSCVHLSRRAREDIDIHQSFYELSGHSLLAARLARELRTTLQVELSLGALFERPTVAGIAAAIREGSAARHASVTLPPLAEGDLPPLYFICGVSLYRPLARRLGPGQPRYGVYLAVEEHILAGAAEPHTVEALASGYVKALCERHPSGPVSLAGVSFGAILAYETARQCVPPGARRRS